METTRPPGFPGNPPARMPRAPTPARSPPPRPLRCGEIAFRPTHDVGPHKQCISGLNHAAYGLPVNASRPGSPQAHASLGSGWRPTLAGWDWIPTGFRTRFQRSHHGILSPLTGLSRHTRWCTARALGEPRSTSWPSWRQQVHDLDMKSRVHPKYKTKWRRSGSWTVRGSAKSASPAFSESKEQFASVEGLSVRQTALKLGVFVCLIRNRISAPAGARSGV